MWIIMWIIEDEYVMFVKTAISHRLKLERF